MGHRQQQPRRRHGWSALEFKDIEMGDDRIKKRLIELSDSLSERPQDSINRASQDWAAAKAAYRFFDNDKVDAEQILSTHRQRSWERLASLPWVLAIQDTSFLNYSNLEIEGLGPISGKGELGNYNHGFVLHTVLAVDPESHEQGIPLGILNQKIWTRKKKVHNGKKPKATPAEFKESNKWVESMLATLSPHSSQKVVHVADREADITPFMMQTIQQEQYFLIRARHDRILQSDGQHSTNLWEHMLKQPVILDYEVDVNQDERRLLMYDAVKKAQTRRMTTIPARLAKVEARIGQVEFADTQGKLIKVTAIYLKEKNPPNELVALEWMLLTNVPTKTKAELRERIRWYKMRWHIESFHKMLKSGCQTESCRMETADRLKRYIALNSVIAWRLYWLSRVGRIDQKTSCEQVLAKHEWQALFMKIKKSKPPQKPPTLAEAMLWIAKLGGFLGRKGDGFPGVKSMWLGWQRLTDCAQDWLVFKTLNNCG